MTKDNEPKAADKVREEFEAWYTDISKPFVVDISRCTDSEQNGQYVDSALDLGWAVWEHLQTVIESQRAVIEQLQARVKELEEDKANIRHSIACYDSNECEAFDCIDSIRQHATETAFINQPGEKE